MNHLAHFAQAGSEPAMIVGSFLGDYIKGRLGGRFDPAIERGIRLHRAIDVFTDQHPVVRRSQQRFQPRFRRYAGIMTDIIYDHLLARAFEQFEPEPLEDFSTQVLATLVDNDHQLTPVAAEAARRMQAVNSLAGYGNELFVERSFTHLAARLTRDNPLTDAATECRQHLDGLSIDLAAFYPDLTDFCAAWKESN